MRVMTRERIRPPAKNAEIFQMSARVLVGEVGNMRARCRNFVDTRDSPLDKASMVKLVAHKRGVTVRIVIMNRNVAVKEGIQV